jgi:hypothetical protein
VVWITIRNIRNKIFERDRSKRKAILSDLSEDWSQYKHYMNSVNIATKANLTNIKIILNRLGERLMIFLGGKRRTQRLTN